MSSLRVLHVIPSIAPFTGGPAEALGRYISSARLFHVSSDVLTTDAKGSDTPEWAGGVDATTIHALRWVPMNVAPALIRELSSRVRAYDCVHLHGNWQFHSVCTALACRVARRPMVVRPCGGLSAMSWARPGKQLYLRVVERHVFDSAAMIHYTSADEQMRSDALIGTRTSSRIVPPSVCAQPTSRSRARRALDIGDDRFIALFVGRLDKIKRCDVLIRAIAVTGRATTLVLAGPDWGELTSLKNLAVALGVADRVNFTGSLPQKSLQNWYAAADCFVSASVHENFGLAIAEACAAGLPCVLPAHLPIAKELGDACLPVEAAPDAFSRTIISLSDAEHRASLSLAAQRHAAAHWSSNVVGQQLREMYESALCGASAGGIGGVS